MEFIVLLVVVVVLVLPVVAVVLAAAALARVGRFEQELTLLRSLLRPPQGAEPPSASMTPRDVRPPEHPASPVPDRSAAPVPPPSVEEPSTSAPPSVAPLPAAPPAARPRVRLEEQIGTRLLVWVGSIAVFLAGAFLVKYTFDAGVLTPTTRVVLGVSFGVVLLGAGEWLRTRSARIAQGITAAGVADLFACFLAAMNLYHLISPAVGFALLALTAAAAVALSLRQGPFVALLGLVGGFLTPALIGPTEPRPGPLFTYLLVLQVGLLVVTRRRGWWPLSALTMVGALIWSGLWLALNYQPEHSVWVGTFLLASVAAFVTATYQATAAGGAQARAEQILSVLGAIAGLVMLALMVGASQFSTLDWVFLGVLGAGAIVLGRCDARYDLLAWLAAAVGAALLAAWRLQTPTLDADRFGGVALALGALYALGAYAALWGARDAGRWASLSAVAAVGHLLLAYWALPQPPLGLRWGVVCVVLAAAYAVGAAPLVKRRARLAAGDVALAALLTGVTTFVSLAVPIELERAWIAVAWSVEVPALALLAAWLRVPALRVLAGCMACLTTIWLFQPRLSTYPLGADPIFDWILYGYGIPALSFAVGAWRFHRQGARRLAEGLEAGTVLLVFALVTLKVRRFFHPEGVWVEPFSLIEWSTYVNAWLILGGAVLLASRGWKRRVLRVAGDILAIGSATAGVLLLALVLNPLWEHAAVGTRPVFNVLLYVYGVPAVIVLLLAGRPFQQGDTPVARTLATVGVLFMFVLLSLEVRHFFHPGSLGEAGVSAREWATYVSGWLLLGGAGVVLAPYWQRAVLGVAGRAFGGMAVLTGIVTLGLTSNPALVHESVGARPVLNDLLYIYGLPGVLIALLAGWYHRTGAPVLARLGAALAVLAIFALVTLEVRHAFRGEFLDSAGGSNAEWYAYSAAWALLGTLLLVLGIVTRGLVLRWASLAVMLLTVGKVFLFDTGQLRDLYRVFSLLGLGLSLLILAFLYQRFVFARKGTVAAA